MYGFKNIANNGYSYFIPIGSLEMYNCILPNNPTAFLRTTEGSIKITNCYGGFTSGWGTQDSYWNYQTNYITTKPFVDKNTYEITDVASRWQNIGTGTDRDGTTADLGVYGGEYSWYFDVEI